MKFGNKLVKFRKEKKLSQEDLADKLGVSRQTISNWELNVTKPDIEYIKKISKVFCVSIDEILDNDVRNIMEEKISNTEKLTNKNTKNIKILLITLYCIILSSLIFVIIYYSTKKDFTNKYQKLYTCTLLEKDSIYGDRADTGIFYLYWDIIEDGFEITIELDYEDDDPIYDEFEKGDYGHPIYATMNGGNSLIEAIDSLNYLKEFFIHYGATCRGR